jgi:phage I-like protein
MNAAAPGTVQAQPNRVDLAAYAPRADLNAMEVRAVTAEKRLAGLDAVQIRREAETGVDEAIKKRKIAPARRAIIGEGPPQAEGSGSALNAEEAGLAKAMGYTAEEFRKITEGKK